MATLPIFTGADIKSWVPEVDPGGALPDRWSGNIIDVFTSGTNLVDPYWVAFREEALQRSTQRKFLKALIIELLQDLRDTNAFLLAISFTQDSLRERASIFLEQAYPVLHRELLDVRKVQGIGLFDAEEERKNFLAVVYLVQAALSTDQVDLRVSALEGLSCIRELVKVKYFKDKTDKDIRRRAIKGIQDKLTRQFLQVIAEDYDI